MCPGTTDIGSSPGSSDNLWRFGLSLIGWIIASRSSLRLAFPAEKVHHQVLPWSGCFLAFSPVGDGLLGTASVISLLFRHFVMKKWVRSKARTALIVPRVTPTIKPTLRLPDDLTGTGNRLASADWVAAAPEATGLLLVRANIVVPGCAKLKWLWLLLLSVVGPATVVDGGRLEVGVVDWDTAC
jgi:hypothetical protein